MRNRHTDIPEKLKDIIKFFDSDKVPAGFNAPIEIIQPGKYEGVVFSYGKCTVNEVADESLKLSFNYGIHESFSALSEEEVSNDPEFEKLLGDIFMEFLLNGKDNTTTDSQ